MRSEYINEIQKNNANKKISKHYKYIDFIRIMACIAVLFYHIGFLKGGFLAVCTFFTLSGYLSCVTAYKKGKMNIGKYYLNRLKKLYLPLVVVVFLTIAVFSIFKLAWVNLKLETTSVLFGYNNFWQLSTNADYFTKNVNSPFTHLWYISILMQFDLVFPFIYITFSKIGKKVNKKIPCILAFILVILSTIYFIYMSKTSDIMNVYYNTFTRVFSILFGVFLGLIHVYFKPLIIKVKNNDTLNKVIFFLYMTILCLMFIFVSSSSKFFAISMIITSVITCRMIDYSVSIKYQRISLFEGLLQIISVISYEIYLVQYPVIFLYQYLDINVVLKNILIILTILIISSVINYILNIKSTMKNKIEESKKSLYIVAFLVILLLGFVFAGVCTYIIAADHKAEMKQLEDLMNKNEILMLEKKKTYEENKSKEESNLQSLLESLDVNDDKINEVITNLKITGIGDSVMLGAADNLYAKFKNGYFDAKVSRSAYAAEDIIKDLNARNITGDIVVLHLGTNGDCTEEFKDKLMSMLSGKKVFWLTVTNDASVRVNDKLKKFAKKYDNLTIIDWNEISKGHPEYFYADGIHLTAQGKASYTDAIYNAIHDMYVEECNAKREKIIKEHEEKSKNNITFYGNDILLNVFDNIKDNFETAEFDINKDYTIDEVKKSLKNAVKNNNLSHNVVFAFNNNTQLTKKDYEEIIEICKDCNIYLLVLDEDTYNELLSLNNDKLHLITLYDKVDVKTHYLKDKIHLNDAGNEILGNLLIENIKV